KGGLRPAPSAELEEPLIVRPTSETIIGATFANWVQSYRDLPLLINQWANVVRWELRTRLFLRTAEFLWQEGHTVHATREEAEAETMQMLGVYADFAENHLAVPVIQGRKTESERFPGAVDTLCIEAMMQDRKALQAGTSHFLGQNFAKASGIKFQDRNEDEQFAWTTSWGVSTRLIGALIMTHADDDGMVVPPMVAPSHVVLLPIYRDDEAREKVLAYCRALAAELRDQRYGERRIDVEVDDRDLRGGEKNWSWIKRGIPLRVEVGLRDVESEQVVVTRRDQGIRDKAFMPREEFVKTIPAILADMQKSLLERAKAFRSEHTRPIDAWDDFVDYFTPHNKKKPEVHGGFALAHWCGEADAEEKVKSELKVTIRCIPLGAEDEAGTCVITGKPSARRVVFAKAY
ncbi:MAG: aminoacyl--tRNA ligase-related protein, partial [Myxococcota bacterium]